MFKSLLNFCPLFFALSPSSPHCDGLSAFLFKRWQTLRADLLFCLFFGLACLMFNGSCSRPAEPFNTGQVDSLKTLIIKNLITNPEVEKQVLGIQHGIERLQDSAAMDHAATLLHKAGNELMDNSRYAEARAFYSTVLPIRQQISGDSNDINILKALHNIGYCYLQTEEDNLTALSYFDRVDIPASKKLFLLYFINKTRKGMALRKTGQEKDGLKHFQIAYDTLMINPEPVSVKRFLADLLTAYSSCLRDQGNLADAIRICQDGMEKIGKGQLDDNPEVLLALGNVWQDSLKNCRTAGDRQYAFGKAEQYTLKALHLYEADEKKARTAGITAGNLGEMYRRYAASGPGFETYYRKAEIVLRNSITLNRQVKPENFNLAHLYMNLGEVYYDQHLLDTALIQYDLSLQCLFPENQSFTLQNLPPVGQLKGVPIEKLTLLSNYAQAYLARSSANANDLVSAAAIYDYLFAYINHLRGEMMSDEAKLELAAKSQDWLHDAFDGNMRLYRETRAAQHLERAFQISEQGKAFALLEAARLRNASAKLPEVEKRERLLLAQADAARTEAEIAEAGKQKLEFFRFLRDKHPGYYNLKYQGLNKTMAEISAVLDTNQALVAYFCQDALLYAFMLNGGRLFVDSFPVSKNELNLHVHRFQQLLGAGFSNPADTASEKALSEEAYLLYQMVFKGLEKFAPPERLVIVPDGPLSNIPFEALSMRRGPSGTGQKDFLVFQHAFSYCFSANMLCEMSAYTVPASLQPKLAVFAPAGNEQNPRKEMENIAERVPAVTFPPEESTKFNFAAACLEYAYIHVATHGLMEKDPNRSYIRFTDPRNGTDTALVLKELYNMRLGQDLITFSACETAIGQFRAGEGNMSLARGLAYSGVRSFITTLWKVPTDGKSHILPDFYESMFQQGLPRDVALARAKCHFLEDKGRSRHPGNWAGLVLIGASTAPETEPHSYWVYALVGLGILLILFLSWKYYRK